MHTALQDSKNDLMLSLRSSPFGPLAHAHAEQNTFNLAYGGKSFLQHRVPHQYGRSTLPGLV